MFSHISLSLQSAEPLGPLRDLLRRPLKILQALVRIIRLSNQTQPRCKCQHMAVIARAELLAHTIHMLPDRIFMRVTRDLDDFLVKQSLRTQRKDFQIGLGQPGGCNDLLPPAGQIMKLPTQFDDNMPMARETGIMLVRGHL